MNNEFNNQNMNQFQNNGINNGYSNNYNDLNNKNDSWKNVLIVILIIISLFLTALTIYVVVDKKDNNEDGNKLSYEIKLVEGNKELYLNDKKVDGIKVDSELGSLEVKEFKDLLIVDEQNPGPSRRLFVVDKNGNATEIDYKVSTYNAEFINSIDSYRVEGNNLYIKVNRQWGNGYIDWYCRYEDNNEVAEYEVKYEYVNGKLGNRQVLNEVTIADKYANEKCNTEFNYEIKTNGANKELYVNDKKVNGISANSEMGNLEVKELKDLLIVDEKNLGPSRRLLVVDKNGNATEIDYKVSTYNTEFINTIDSYRVEGNNLYIKINRQWGNGYIDWYCHYIDKNEVAEYEVKYEYVNGSLANRQVLNEIKISNKYKNETCDNDNSIIETPILTGGNVGGNEYLLSVNEELYANDTTKLSGFELYEKKNNEYILIYSRDNVYGVTDIVRSGESKIYVARVYAYDKSMGKVYSSYSNEVRIDN